MLGTTRAVLTLAGAGVAGFLLWLATQVNVSGTWDYWASIGLIAAAGLVMALSQLLGGWTKWGWPRISPAVFLFAFVPVLIAGGWVLASVEPGSAWLGDHVRSWTGSLGLGALVADLQEVFRVLAFGIGLVFGLTFDTSGPRVARTEPVSPAEGADPEPEPEPVRDGTGRAQHPLARDRVGNRD